MSLDCYWHINGRGLPPGQLAARTSCDHQPPWRNNCAGANPKGRIYSLTQTHSHWVPVLGQQLKRHQRHIGRNWIVWHQGESWEGSFIPHTSARRDHCWCWSWPAGSCVVAAIDKYTRTTEILWRKRDGMAILWERARGLERDDPCLDRLLLLFWAHYIEDGPHLLYTGSL